MPDAIYFYGSDCTSWQRCEKHPSHTVAERLPVPLFERFDNKFPVSLRRFCLCYDFKILINHTYIDQQNSLKQNRTAANQILFSTICVSCLLNVKNILQLIAR